MLISQAQTFSVIMDFYTGSVNRLAKNNYRDQLAATPIHYDVACRVGKQDPLTT